MKCWNCGVEPMSPFETLGKGWFKCSSCGATWIKPLKLGAPTVIMKRDDMIGESSLSPSIRESKRGVKK